MHLDHGGNMNGIRYKTLAIDDIIIPYTDPVKEKQRQSNILQMKSIRKMNVSAVSPILHTEENEEEEEEVVVLDDIEVKTSESTHISKKKKHRQE